MNVLRDWKFHPFLISIYPLLTLAVWNYGRLIWGDIFRPLSLILALVTIALVFLYKLQRSLARAALEVSLTSMLFFSYGHLLRWLFTIRIWKQSSDLAVLITSIWLAVWIVGLWKLSRSKRQFEAATVFCNVVSLVLIGSMLLQLGWMDLESRSVKREAVQNLLPDRNFIPVTGNQPPDIYYIILDSYARDDVILNTLAYNNSGFTSELQSQGFFVGRNSYSNYGQTIFSIASSLNFDYLTPVTIGNNGKNLDYHVYRELIDQNRVMQFLKQQGYEIITIESGYDITEVKNSDLYVQFPPNVNNVEIELLKNSPSVFFIQNWLPSLKRERLVKSFESLVDLSRRPSPKFVFLHVLALHSPFLFDQNGAPVSAQISEQDGYRGQMLYVNQLVEETVSKILENSETEPVIILQGDHGLGEYSELLAGDKDGLQKRFSILNAIYFPASQRANLYNEISPVNTFRLVFNTFFGTDLVLLKDESYYSLLRPAYDFFQ